MSGARKSAVTAETSVLEVINEMPAGLEGGTAFSESTAEMLTPKRRLHSYGAGTIKRARRTKDEVEQLDHQILDVLRQDHPQSVRHCFYRMTDPRLPEPVEKSERGYRHVQHRVVELRRAGVLPYDWITDSSRRGYFTDTFSGAGDFIEQLHDLL